MKTSKLLQASVIAATCLAFSPTLHASATDAENTAYRLAQKYVEKGFDLAPTDNHGSLRAGESVRFLIPVSKGQDYVFLIGSDQNARDVDIYVYDDMGNLVLDDRRPERLAGVQFRSGYNGTAVVYLHMADAEGLASWYAVVGRRGLPKPETAPPPSPENESPSQTNPAPSPSAVAP